jgi:leader peptidase (prepilin peptidase)/N-methyltransferase
VFGLSADAAVAAGLCVVLVVLSAIDLEHKKIPTRIVRPAGVAALAAQSLLHPSLEWLLAAVGAYLFLGVAAFVYPAGMGMGDARLAFLMGAVLGRTVPVAMMVAMLVSMLPSIYLFARHGMKARKMGFPFGPFLAIGAVVGLFWGHDLLDAYLSTTR